MGDRCYQWVRCHKSDAEKFFEAMGTEFEDFDDGTVVFEDEESDYGSTEDFPQDVPWLMGHDAGSEYGPGLAAHEAGHGTIECEANCDGFPVVECDSDGVPRAEDLARVGEYVAARDRIKADWAGRQAAGQA